MTSNKVYFSSLSPFVRFVLAACFLLLLVGTITVIVGTVLMMTSMSMGVFTCLGFVSRSSANYVDAAGTSLLMVLFGLSLSGLMSVLLIEFGASRIK